MNIDAFGRKRGWGGVKEREERGRCREQNINQF